MNKFDYEKSVRCHLPILQINEDYSDHRMQISGHDHHGVDFSEEFDKEDWASVCEAFNIHLLPNLACDLVLTNLDEEIENYMDGFTAPFVFTEETQATIKEDVQAIALKYAKQLIEA